MKIIASVLLALVSFFGVTSVAPAEASPNQVEKTLAAPTVTPSSWEMCSWVAVRDGLVWPGSPTRLRYSRSFSFFGDPTWVKCQVIWDRGDFNTCITYIVWRGGTIPGYNTDTLYYNTSSCAWP